MHAELAFIFFKRLFDPMRRPPKKIIELWVLIGCFVYFFPPKV